MSWVGGRGKERMAPVDVLILVGRSRIDSEGRRFSTVATAVHPDGHRGRCSIRRGPRAGVEVLLCLTVGGGTEGPQFWTSVCAGFVAESLY